MPARSKDMTGMRFGEWKVLGRAGKANSQITWRCRCSCGNEREIRGGTLRQGLSKSCGECLDRSTPRQTHGLSNTRAYAAWSSMINRCWNVSNKSYQHYGGRGISVCSRWQEGVEFFVEDMGEPEDGMTLDRVDVDGNYTPENCRWITQKEQTRNARSNIQLTHDGRTQCVGEWAEELGMKYGTLYNRVVTLGWPVDKALTTPVRGR